MIEGERELTFRLGNLVITLRGPLEECARAQPRISACLSSSSPPQASRSSSDFVVIDPPAEEASPADRGASARRSSAPPETRSDVLLGGPGKLIPCIALFVLGNRLQRAWIAGQWASAVAAGFLPPPIGCRRSFTSYSVPPRSQSRLVTTSAAYFRIVGRPFHQQSLSRSFASLLEVRVCCDSAGVAVPEQQRIFNLSQLQQASVSSPALLVLGWPEEDGGPPVVEAYAMCLLKRQGVFFLQCLFFF